MSHRGGRVFIPAMATVGGITASISGIPGAAIRPPGFEMKRHEVLEIPYEGIVEAFGKSPPAVQIAHRPATTARHGVRVWRQAPPSSRRR